MAVRTPGQPNRRKFRGGRAGIDERVNEPASRGTYILIFFNIVLPLQTTLEE